MPLQLGLGDRSPTEAAEAVTPLAAYPLSLLFAVTARYPRYRSLTGHRGRGEDRNLLQSGCLSFWPDRDSFSEVDVSRGASLIFPFHAGTLRGCGSLPAAQPGEVAVLELEPKGHSALGQGAAFLFGKLQTPLR